MRWLCAIRRVAGSESQWPHEIPPVFSIVGLNVIFFNIMKPQNHAIPWLLWQVEGPSIPSANTAITPRCLLRQLDVLPVGQRQQTFGGLQAFSQRRHTVAGGNSVGRNGR